MTTIRTINIINTNINNRRNITSMQSDAVVIGERVS